MYGDGEPSENPLEPGMLNYFLYCILQPAIIRII
jgi:hypothetical protein